MNSKALLTKKRLQNLLERYFLYGKNDMSKQNFEEHLKQDIEYIFFLLNK